ncbi:hypothetical protein [Streptosporangium sp. V21-05]|uniref:hypothetical protein n=1 Tax=Streptosporangium sp. V21-05 TaxID=3446115 RepID=UPI003F537978
MSSEREFIIRAYLHFEYRVKAEDADAAVQVLENGEAGDGECVGYSVEAVVTAKGASQVWGDEDERSKCVCGHLVVDEHQGLWSGEPGKWPKPHPAACNKLGCECLAPVEAVAA